MFAQADLTTTKMLRLAIIGTGMRAKIYADILVGNIRKHVHIQAIVDTNEARMHKFLGMVAFKSAPNLYTDYKQMLDTEAIDAVIICTPDLTHKDIAIEVLRRNVHVLLEKPIATTLEDSIAIYNASLRQASVFRLGFVLRYIPLYREVKQIVSSGVLGTIVTVEAKETLGHMHAGSFFRRWHRFKENNGGFLNAKCSHDIDLLNWILGAEPEYISAFGGRSYFNPLIGAASHCRECSLTSSCKYYYDMDAERSTDGTNTYEDLCVYNSEKDIVDHEVLNVQYNSGVTASFTVSMLSAEANRTMVIFGSEATLIADYDQHTIVVKYIHPQKEHTYRFNKNASEHGGGDEGICMNFIDSINMEYDATMNDGRAGLLSSAVALGGELSMAEKLTVHLPTLLKLKG